MSDGVWKVYVDNGQGRPKRVLVPQSTVDSLDDLETALAEPIKGLLPEVDLASMPLGSPDCPLALQVTTEAGDVIDVDKSTNLQTLKSSDMLRLTTAARATLAR